MGHWAGGAPASAPREWSGGSTRAVSSRSRRASASRHRGPHRRVQPVPDAQRARAAAAAAAAVVVAAAAAAAVTAAAATEAAAAASPTWASGAWAWQSGDATNTARSSVCFLPHLREIPCLSTVLVRRTRNLLEDNTLHTV
eukprot:scaffold86115_cov51-Phaeocystis_antarctica.AAC.2